MQAWLVEREDAATRVQFRVRRVLHRERSPYQTISVVELESMGRALVLDDAIQVTERDAFVYHEMLVHVPACAHPRPRRVLVVGGGDGGTLLELARHPEVERIDLVEIDRRVVEVSRRFLPWAEAAFSDPRLTLHYADGARFLERPPSRFDLILVDAPDPVGPGEALFGDAFYEAALRALQPGGMLVTQSGSIWFQSPLLAAINRRLARWFGRVHTYLASVPTYSIGPWSFTVGSSGPDPRAVDAARARRLATRYYTAEVHRAAFVLPRFVQQQLDEAIRATPRPLRAAGTRA
ncbi:polyamine aminopropyltransferase [Carboxydochorda subterranea]|uniref:Polyamine aminopropyltransferase n=1 Tax=Carboxydichorda subterranea TaxID=3109565 RepID=A0ABZ1BV06_9FIRM|nr:polyamine aminopropyltransferase [Limnochorda sp. L945t]WRP16325.1 polyamine aminopropyltransferase [Limnochorda sp. L945t]